MAPATGNIRILPEILSNQIAAGEVVQRPASVVKELVENSMDAGADRITVEIEKGGRVLIRISDNGTGMARDQAMLAVERYATSKIFAKEDLFSIATFGFRGEALPSIASVSKFSLVSRPHDRDTGTRIDIDGGKLRKVSDAGAPPGTMVEVRQLFFNTPARRKFLKAETTETGHISDAMAGLAMGNPDIGFRLFFNKKLVRNFPPGQNLIQRARMVLGKDAADHLYPLSAGAEKIKISGACANPSVTRSTPNRIYLFVNHRLVHDRGLVAALFRGYRGRIMKGRYPMGVVCVDLSYDEVDVNVHPTKREIKFLYPQPVYQLLGQAVQEALANAQTDALAYSRSRIAPVMPAGRPAAPRTGPATEKRDDTASSRGGYEIPDAPAGPPLSVSEAAWPAREPHRDPIPASDALKNDIVPKNKGGEPFPPDETLPDPGIGPSRTGPAASARQPGRIVGQVMGTYIVVEQDAHLVLVDQHAAHERIVYESLKKRHNTIGIQRQDLMVPEILDLTGKEADVLASVLEEMAALGVTIEPFGGTSFVIKSVPVLVGDRSVKQMILEMIEQLSRDNRTGARDDWLDDCLVTMACHRAIRAKKSMTRQEMEQLMTDLWACENPMHCPHGRPIVISFDARHLEKLFKRLV